MISDKLKLKIQMSKLKTIFSRGKSKSGIALFSALIVMSLLSLLVIGFLNIIIGEIKINNNQSQAQKAHYLAEAGINWAIDKLKNDSNWNNALIAGNLPKGTTGQASLDNFLWDQGQVDISVNSIEPGKAWINTQAYFNNAVRIVKTKIYQPLPPEQDNGSETRDGSGGSSDPNPEPIIYPTITANEGIDISSAYLTLSGDMLSNEEITLRSYSHVYVNGIVKSAEKISIGDGCELTADEQIYPCQSQYIPSFDFSSYKNNADQVLSSQEMADLLDSSSLIELSGIIYVTGDIHIKPGQNLTINGILLTDGSLRVGSHNSTQISSLIVNSNVINPSGVAVKENISIYKKAIFDIKGLVYCGEQVYTYKNEIFNLTGGLLANTIIFFDQGIDVQINSDNDLVSLALNPSFSSGGGSEGEDSDDDNGNENLIFDIEHWEEEY